MNSEISPDTMVETIASFIKVVISVRHTALVGCPAAAVAFEAMDAIMQDIRNDYAEKDADGAYTLYISDEQYLVLRERMLASLRLWMRSIKTCPKPGCPDKDSPVIPAILADMALSEHIEKAEAERPEATVIASIGRWN